MKRIRRRISCSKIILWFFLTFTVLCLVGAGISAIANSRLPTQSPVVDRLTEADKARLAEAAHLRQSLGEEIIPGWSQADIPLILYNEQYVFLAGYPNPPAGWDKVPGGPHRGVAWEQVPGDTFQGMPYYRQRMSGKGEQPENFTVRVGDRWVTSLMTLDWFKISMAQMFREGVPGPFKAVFPYPVAVSLFMGSSEQYMTLMLHESAHTYQGMRVPGKLASAETGVQDLVERYPWTDKKVAEGWQAELDCLRDGVTAKTDAGARAQAARFLELRKTRRQAANLDAGLVDFERGREWEEGFAKYAELSAYRLAATTPGYTPTNEIENDPQFHHYRDFSQRWQNEVNQISLGSRQKEEEIRFYYSGWAQAVLLDRLSPGWKARLFDDGVWLEDLLAEAVDK